MRLVFATKTVEGASYRFDGRYLEDFGKEIAGDGAYLEGKMTKLVNGQAVSENRLRFAPYIMME